MKVSVRSTVDLLVLGGSVSGIELAIKEKKAGYSVLLATPFSYFGDDVCSTMNFRNIPDFRHHSPPVISTVATNYFFSALSLLAKNRCHIILRISQEPHIGWGSE